MTDNRTTELREKLTERGVSWSKPNSATEHIETSFLHNGWGVEILERCFGLCVTATNVFDTPEQAIAATLGSDTKGCENLLWELVGALDVADASDADKKPIVAEYARRIATTLGSDDRYDAGFASGIQAVFQQLEGIESCEELQDLIAEYWGEGEGNDER